MQHNLKGDPPVLKNVSNLRKTSLALTLMTPLAAMILASCARNEAAEAPAAPPPVQAAKVVTKAVTEFDEFTGRFEAVERVEVIRGPASALYGANAFLGVINVITRSGKSVEGARLVGQVGAIRDRPGYGGGLLLGASAENAEVVAAVQGMRLDRSGLSLPDSSPLLDSGRDDPVEEEAIPSSAGRAAIAGAESLIVGQILAGNAERLPELLPDIVYITTVPYLGQEEALRQSREAEKLLEPPGG